MDIWGCLPNLLLGKFSMLVLSVVESIAKTGVNPYLKGSHLCKSL